MPRISKEYELNEFLQILQGSTEMPDLFIDELIDATNTIAFTKKIAQNETKFDRFALIYELWIAIKDSGNDSLTQRFAKNALSSKKTGDDNAYKILFWLSKNAKNIYGCLLKEGTGSTLYPQQVIKAINSYYRYGIQKVLDKCTHIDDAHEQLQELII